MKQILLLVAIYSLVFYQSSKLTKPTTPSTKNKLGKTVKPLPAALSEPVSNYGSKGDSKKEGIYPVYQSNKAVAFAAFSLSSLYTGIRR